MSALEKMRVVVVGPGGVGKSAITLRFVRNQFLAEYDPTIEDSYSKEVEVDGIMCNLDITDTAGQEEFRGLWGDKHIQAGDGFLLVFACDEAATLEDLEEFKTQISRVKDSNTIPMVICGNKVDLVDTREVETEQGQEFAENANATFMETSAKSGNNIEESFKTLIRLVREERKKVAEKKAKADQAKKAAPPPNSAGDSKAGSGGNSGGGKSNKQKKKKGGCTLL